MSVRAPWISSHAEVPALTYYLGGESASTKTVHAICDKLLRLCVNPLFSIGGTPPKTSKNTPKWVL